jgi:hypothetical protein
MLWFMKAARFADAQEFDLARECNNRAVDRCKDKGSADYAISQYSLARTELLASEVFFGFWIIRSNLLRIIQKPKYTSVNVLTSLRYIRTSGIKRRALGEIALLEKSHEASNEILFSNPVYLRKHGYPSKIFLRV